MWAPSFVRRKVEKPERDARVVDLMWSTTLERAFENEVRPWPSSQTHEDLESRVKIVKSPTEAARLIDSMRDRGGVAAIDYETNCLKPETPGARILCCSISWMGKETIAYPWHGEAIAATRRFWFSDVWKIASNMKFEDRWTIAEFGKPARRWLWDQMLSAHHLDQRKGITSVKFQSFVLCGYSNYNDHIEPFMEAAENGLNGIEKHIELNQLLTYCGVDSLVEYEVALEQSRIAGDPRREKML